MWKKSAIVTVAVLAMALAIGFFGCENQESPVEDQEEQWNVLPDSFGNYKEEPVLLMDLGAVNYPINPWLPLNGYPFGVVC